MTTTLPPSLNLVTSLLSQITGLFLCFPLSPNSLRSWCLINSDSLIESSISSSQFGFIRNHSTVKQILLHTKNIICASERNKQLDTINLDIRKAFDTVPHDLLLLNLWNVGVTGFLWRLLQTYFSYRRQCVSVEGHYSGWLPVDSGVPQSSILRPLLFIIHINDLPSFLSFSSTLLYANDTKLSTPVSSPSDCSLLHLWGSQSGLSFNVSKSFLLHFCNRSPLASVDYSLKDSVISCVSSCRDLGVIFSSDLSWTEHYKVISRNAYNQLCHKEIFLCLLSSPYQKTPLHISASF